MTRLSHATQPNPTTTSSTFSSRRRTRLRPLLWLFPLLGVAIGSYFLSILPWMSRWGTTRAEVSQTLSGDELVPQTAFVTTKAVTIDAPPDAIWPWLVQLGVDRGGMYSYLWVENWLFRLHVENSDEIRPEWQTLQVGDFIRFTPLEYRLNPGPGLYVLGLEPNRALLGCFGLENAPPDCTHSATWQFVLAPQADGSTRLLLRSRMADPGSALARTGIKLTQPFVFYMERKMLLTLKGRAETLAALQ